MIYKLMDGSRVRTTKVDTGVQFETTNAGREVVSMIVLSGSEAREMETALLFADAQRFVRVYGSGPQTLSGAGA